MMKNLEKFNYNKGDKVTLKDGTEYLITDRNITMMNIGMYQVQDPDNVNHKYWMAAHLLENSVAK